MRQKVKTYFLPVSYSKKGQAKPALFWSKGKETHYALHDPVGAHCVRPLAVTRRMICGRAQRAPTTIAQA
ncbi:MAG: hypothetical protein LBC37_08295, partial [Zoogloeaceae bacterium]|nr:hypothetical protein [Zoogloeaceae bacterium]